MIYVYVILTSINFRAWRNSHANINLWYVITHSFPNFHGGVAKPPLEDMDDMMTLSNGKISALLALCAGNSPITDEFPCKDPWRGALMFSFSCAWINGWANNKDASDLKRHRADYDVTVMEYFVFPPHIILCDKIT